METKRLEKAEAMKRLRKEQKLRRVSLAQVSALPRPEAEMSIQRQMQDMMKPLIAELGSIKEQLQKNSDPPRTDRTDQLIASRKEVERGNRSAPRAADAGGAATKSANRSRTETNQDASDVEQEASSAQPGKRKRRRRPEAKATADAPTPPSAAESGDRASDPGPMKHGKPGKRRRRKGTAEKDQE